MNDYFLSGLIGCLVGAVGTGVGGALSFFFKNQGKRLPAALMGFSGGIVLAIVLLHMAPESIELAGWLAMLLWAVAGAIFVEFLHKVLPHHDVQVGCDEAEIERMRAASLAQTGILLCIGVAIHNLPEGLAIGAGLEQPDGFGLELALLLIVHNIPEGLAMAAPLRLGGFRNGQVLLLTVLAGLPTAIGAVIGVLIGQISPVFIGSTIAFGGGAMLYLTVKELVPQALRLCDKKMTLLSLLVGLGVGAAAVFFL